MNRPQPAQSEQPAAWQFETLRLSGDGLTLAADVIGDRAGPPVVFFHGGGQGRGSWRGAARKLAAAGYRAYTVDLRGHGDSDWAANGDYLLDAYGRDVEQILVSLGRAAILVGASRGGQAALVGGSRRQEFVTLIMLADVAPGIANTGVDQIRNFLHRSLSGFASVEEAADVLVLFMNKPRADDLRGLRKAMRIGRGGKLFWRWDPHTADPEFLNPPSETLALEAAAARLHVPAVLVRAELSSLVTEESVRLFQKLTPQLRVIEAKGAGHMFTGDRNDAFADTLLEHLAGLAAPRREI